MGYGGAPRPATGVSVIEALIAMATLGVLLALSLPTLRGWQEAHRLRSASTLVHNDLRLAQAEARKRQTGLTVRFQRAGPGRWCYGWHMGGGCDCTLQSGCHIDGAPRVVTGDDWPDIDLQPNVAEGIFGINPARGTITAGNVTLQSPSGYAVRVVVHGMGRIRSCVPSTSPPLAGIPPC